MANIFTSTSSQFVLDNQQRRLSHPEYRELYTHDVDYKLSHDHAKPSKDRKSHEHRHKVWVSLWVSLALCRFQNR